MWARRAPPPPRGPVLVRRDGGRPPPPAGRYSRKPERAGGGGGAPRLPPRGGGKSGARLQATPTSRPSQRTAGARASSLPGGAPDTIRAAPFLADGQGQLPLQHLLSKICDRTPMSRGDTTRHANRDRVAE